MIGLRVVYAVAGVIFGLVALASFAAGRRDRGWAAGLFWSLLAVSFLAGDALSDLQNGALVLALVGAGLLMRPPRAAPTAGAGDGQAPGARPVGRAIFIPILAVPIVTLAGTLLLGRVHLGGSPLVDPKQATVVALVLAVLAGLALALAIVRPAPAAPFVEARRLMNQVGAAAVLPQLLAALGAVFTLAGVGHAVQSLIGAVVPMGSLLPVIAAYAAGMAAFTLIMGNAFAAFPIMTAALGAPLLAGRFGGDPAAIGALGMLSGFCGTLMTPMASHNIVPAALLDLKIGAVIRAQAPTAIAVLLANMGLLYVLAFRH